jgi:hypothetical protein
MHQDSEGLAIGPTGPLDQVSIHLDLRVVAAGVAAITSFDGGFAAERSHHVVLIEGRSQSAQRF